MDKKEIKILLVDDEPDILEIVSYNLKNEGYQIYTANNGLKAIEKAIKHPDGKYNFTLIGLQRFRIISEKEGKSYRQAEIELLEEKNEQDIIENQPNECREKLIKNFREFLSFIPEGNPQKKEPDWNLGNKLSEFIDRFAYQLDLSLEQKQSFLEEQDVLKRGEFLHSFLKMKIDLIHLSKKQAAHDPRWN